MATCDLSGCCAEEQGRSPSGRERKKQGLFLQGVNRTQSPQLILLPWSVPSLSGGAGSTSHQARVWEPVEHL